MTKEAEEFIALYRPSVYEMSGDAADDKTFNQWLKVVLQAERERCVQAVDEVDTPYFIVDACVAAIRGLK